MTARAQFATATAPAPAPVEPQPPAAPGAPTASSPVAAVIGTLPGTRPVPAPRAGGARRSTTGPSPLTRLFRWVLRVLGLGRARAGQLTAQDWRLIALGVAALLIISARQDSNTPAAAAAPPALPVGANVAAAAQVLDLARADVGTVEGPDGGTPFHRAYGIAAREPWCAVFIWDVFKDAGGADSVGPKTAYTPTMAAWFRAQGRWSATPAAGALVFYDWPSDGTNRIQHVGIVESFTATTITTIEGNTSGSNAGSQDDGDGVWERTRPRNRAIVGYGLPIYGLAS